MEPNLPVAFENFPDYRMVVERYMPEEDRKLFNEIYNPDGSRRESLQSVAKRYSRSPEAIRRKLMRVAFQARGAYEEEQDTARFIKEGGYKEESINTLHLDVRSSNACYNNGVKTIGDLLEKTECEVLAWRNFGKLSLWRLVDKLDKLKIPHSFTKSC